MATPTIYGAELYGIGALYGRISAGLQLAQAAQVRETALKVSILDELLNNWDLFVDQGNSQDPRQYFGDGEVSYHQRYYSYRGASSAVKLDNGNIIRVRVDVASRDLYVQTITDPTVAAQWTSWALLYSGPWFGVDIAPASASTYAVYTTGADGVYKNNALMASDTDLVGVRCHRDVDTRQVLDALWVMKVDIGHVLANGAVMRKFDFYWTPDVTSVGLQPAEWNWIWQRHTALSFERDDGKIIRLQAYPAYAPLSAINTGESVFVTEHDSLSEMVTYKPPRLIRGLGADYGHINLSGFNVVKLLDGYYYMFYVEAHVDNDWLFISNLEVPLMWQRSKDCIFWSEPVNCGLDLIGGGGIIESGGFVYLITGNKIYRRPNGQTTTDITNYVNHVEWEVPRENQPGTGTARVANPAGINNGLFDLDDRKIKVEVGLKVAGANYEYAQLDDFWVTRVKKEIDGDANRINLEFGNIWARLSNPLRDVFNFIGKTEYRDFSPGFINEPFNYFFETGTGTKNAAEFPMDVTTGKVVWTGWKGYNSLFHATIVSSTASPVGVVCRYIGPDDYMLLEYDGSNTLTLTEVVAGVPTSLNSAAVGAGVSRFGIRSLYKSIEVFAEEVSIFTVLLNPPGQLSPGYVGFYSTNAYIVLDFVFEDLEFDLHSDDLIKQAIAMADYWDPIIGGAVAKQLSLTWGPQTDLPTPADALRQLLEAEKLELIWRDGFIEIGQFKDNGIFRVLQNEIIESSEIGDPNERINLAAVDGNADSWIEVDADDAQNRGRMLNAYFDIPELLAKDDVRNRAQEEIRRGKLSQAPAGKIPLQLDLWRMDAVTWIDNTGDSRDVRIEGIKVTIEQGAQPSQRQELDTSLL